MKNRALIYMEMYDVLSAEVGAAQAEALLTEAIFRRGLAAGKSLARHAPDDLAGLKTSFLASVPGGEEIFRPQVLRCDRDRAGDAAARLPAEGCLARGGIARGKDRDAVPHRRRGGQGPVRGAGFRFENRTWTPGAERLLLPVRSRRG